MTTRTKLFAIVAVLAAGISFARCTAADATPRTELTIIQQTEDSVTLLLSWTSVLDRRGQPVVRYLWSVVSRTDSVLASDSAAGLGATVVVARPLPGADTVWAHASVQARDDNAMLGQSGVSSEVALFRVDTLGPAAPTVTIDTLAVSLLVDTALVQRPGCAISWDVVTVAGPTGAQWRRDSVSQHEGRFLYGTAFSRYSTDEICVRFGAWVEGWRVDSVAFIDPFPCAVTRRTIGPGPLGCV